MKSLKRGEISTSEIGGILLGIIGFSIVLFFIFQINWKGQIDRETCHQSVIFRATLPVFGNLKDYVPLKCKTEKICITSGFIGGTCEEFKGSKGITKMKVKSVTQVEKIFTEEILECWTMMGEGKAGIFSQWIAQNYGLGQVYPTCVICSRIALDKEGLKKAGVDIQKMDVMGYMQTHLIPNKNYTYYAYMLRENPPGVIPVSTPQSIPYGRIDENGEVVKISSEEELKEALQIDRVDSIMLEQQLNDDIQYKETAILFMQIAAPKYSDSFKNTLTLLMGTAGVTSIASPSLAKKAGTTLIKGGWYTVAIAAIAGTYQMGSVAWNRAVSASYCGDVSLGGDGGSDGCSVVRTTRYDAESIGQYCQVIESIP